MLSVLKAGPSGAPMGAGQRGCRRFIDESQTHCSTARRLTRGKNAKRPEHAPEHFRTGLGDAEFEDMSQNSENSFDQGFG